MKGLKKLLPIGLVVALVALSPTAVFAATEDGVEATFTGNSTPSLVTALQSITDLTPQVEATIHVTVTDADGYADIGEVILRLYYDVNNATDETEFDTKTTGSATEVAYITWTSGGTFVLTEAEDSSWSVGACTPPAASNLDNPFIFKITPGKVAKEASSGASDCWQIAATVTDDSSVTAFDADTSDTGMNWYGEVSGVSASAAFGIVAPGSTFTANTVGSLSANYIANGSYDEKIKVASDAFTGGTGTVVVDVTDFNASAANEIAFKASDDSTYGNATGVNASGVTLDNSGTITTESGDTVATNQLWLAMNSTYTCTGEKTGTIYFMISDGS